MRVILSESLKGRVGSRANFLNRTQLELRLASSASDLLQALRSSYNGLAIIDSSLTGLEDDGVRGDVARLLDKRGLKCLLVVNGDKNLKPDDPLLCSCAGVLAAPFTDEDFLNWIEGQVGFSRRNHIRARISVDVKCEYPFHVFTGEIQNLSQGGLLFETNMSLNLGAIIRLDFALPDVGYFITTLGKIVWSMADRCKGRQRYGVEFLKINRDDQTMIGLFIKHQALG
ncbi:PilZ domain-containing protein [Acidobacteriota bacterium]